MNDRTLLAVLLGPGMRLMRRWRLSTKFMSLSVLAFVSTLILTLNGASELLDQLRSTQQERQGVAGVQAAADLTWRVLAHRDAMLLETASDVPGGSTTFSWIEPSLKGGRKSRSRLITNRPEINTLTTTTERFKRGYERLN